MTSQTASKDECLHAVAREALGDLSRANLRQLVTLYRAFDHADDALLSALNQPRMDSDACNNRPMAIIEDEQGRLFHMRGIIAGILRQRLRTGQTQDYSDVFEAGACIASFAAETSDDYGANMAGALVTVLGGEPTGAMA